MPSPPIEPWTLIEIPGPARPVAPDQALNPGEVGLELVDRRLAVGPGGLEDVACCSSAAISFEAARCGCSGWR